jgi:hypothetical protein
MNVIAERAAEHAKILRMQLSVIFVEQKQDDFNQEKEKLTSLIYC